ncbi:hypothetical protein DVH24_014397 [Malus domestica]|uniref:Citrate transporter-like domain-containing protein n=1 Tax=Malus domestica TaxID=3750 RepID=A0A498IWI7_MALDO|nr:hypothetical protein DVH24_014397 [Malus domestica]
MKGLFKSKPRTPADIVRQTRDLLVYAQRPPDSRESKREEKMSELCKNIRELKSILYGSSESEPNLEVSIQCFCSFNLNCFAYILHYPLWVYVVQAQKDATQVVANLQRQQVQSKLIASDYLEANIDLMDVLIQGYGNTDMALHYGAILRECIRHQNPKTPLLPLHDQIQRSQSFHSSLKSILTLKNFSVLLGPRLCTIICLCVKLDGPVASRNMLAVLVWVFAWWLTEAVPMPVTSMSPLFLFPLFGIASADDVAHSYMNDVIALVLGSFILALAVEHYNIHKRLALNVNNPGVLWRSLESAIVAAGNMWTAAFISMWMHNVATAVMMMPVATGILRWFPTDPDQSVVVSNFCKAVILGVLSSGQALSVYLDKAHLKKELELLGRNPQTYSKLHAISIQFWLLMRQPAGPMAFAEKMMLIVLWKTRSITEDIPGWGVLFNRRAGDGTVSITSPHHL